MQAIQFRYPAGPTKNYVYFYLVKLERKLRYFISELDFMFHVIILICIMEKLSNT